MFLFTAEDSPWTELARKAIVTIEAIVYDDPNQDTSPTKLENVPLHPRPRPEQPGKLSINSQKEVETANLLIFIEHVPDNLELPELKAVHLFVGIENDDIAEKFPYLKNASPDIADPQFIVDGWVSSIRTGYCYYGYRKGSLPPMPVQQEEGLPPPIVPEPVTPRKPWWKRFKR